MELQLNFRRAVDMKILDRVFFWKLFFMGKVQGKGYRLYITEYVILLDIMTIILSFMSDS